MKIDRSIPPATSDISSVRIPMPGSSFLSNGIPVYSFDLADQELAKIEVVFRSGLAHQSQNLVADFTAKMLTEGTKNRTGIDIANTIDFYGSFLEHSISKDFSSFTLYCLTKYADESLDLFADILCNPTFPEKEFETHKRNGLQRFKVNSDKVSVLCKREFGKLLYVPNHPYYSEVDEADFNLSTDQLQTHFSEMLNFSDAFIFVSGHVKQTLIRSLDRTFGKVGLKKMDKSEVLRIDNSLAQNSVIPKEGALQSGIRIGRLLPIQRASTDYVPFSVLNTVLGGYFSSRLMSNIREDKGYTYGIGSGLIRSLASTTFLISTEVNAEHTQDTISEINREINRLQNDKVPDMELSRVKNYMIGAYLKKSDGPFNVCDQFKSYFLHGIDLSYNDSYLSEIQEVSSENVRDLAEKFLNFEDLLQVVAGKL